VSHEGEGGVEVTLSSKELVLELNPMESDGMESTLHDIHHHQDGHGDSPEGEPHDKGSEDSQNEGSVRSKGLGETLFDEDGSQLRMSER